MSQKKRLNFASVVILISGLIGFCGGLVAESMPGLNPEPAEVEPQSVPDESSVVVKLESQDKSFVSNGDRVSVENKGFSLVPPKNWEVHTDFPNLTLLMQIPHKKGQKYQRTIQVASFTGSRYIDEVTAKEFEEIITRKFSEASASLEDFRIRNHLAVEMDDGRNALLFYSEFMYDSSPLMQAHILVSSTDRHFLITYTDLAQHFEDDVTNSHLKTAWESMTSTQLSTRTPTRYESPMVVGILIAAFVVLGLGFWGFRSWVASRRYQNMAINVLDDKEPLSSHEEVPLDQVSIHASYIQSEHGEDSDSYQDKGEYNDDDMAFTDSDGKAI